MTLFKTLMSIVGAGIIVSGNINFGAVPNHKDTVAISPTQFVQPKTKEVEQNIKDDSKSCKNDSTASEDIELVELGQYTITAYCPCSTCCGSWADKRPLDENGNPIVCGSSGEVLISGKSAASPLPFGTRLYLAEYGIVTVEDRTSNAIAERCDNKIIDIYFSSHQEALNFGKRYLNVYELKEANS